MFLIRRNPVLHSVISDIQMNTTNVPMTLFIFESARKPGFQADIVMY